MSDKLRTIVIAGASSGLGKALGNRYFKSGYDVYGCGRRSLDRVGRIQYRRLDLTDGDGVSSWLAGIETIDVFIDCVGILLPKKPFIQFSNEEIDLALEVNLRAKLRLFQKVLRRMENRRQGVYLSLASNPEGCPLPDLSLYAMCKTAHERLIESVAEELDSAITVVSLYPGLVDTPTLRNRLGQEAGQYPSARDWAELNADRLLRVSRAQSGKHIALSDLPNSSQ